ncbi:phospholipase [Pyrenochaeta sp. MPI-SDFR-AT-0127]|nr:phospholipase [Pyrenochaeta sp. MPI-SDFR-AT-0127]
MVETTPDDVHAEMKESASTTSSEEVHTSPAATTHSASDQTHESAGYCLLALDGGGVRGLSTLFILQNIMNRLNYIRSRAGLQPKKPCDIFDLIGGTSTGGLIAIMLGRLQMSVEECITAYVTLMKEVFEKRINRSRIDFRGKVKPQFSSTVLKEAISKVVRGCGVPLDEKFDNGSEPRCKVFVCTNLQATNTIARLRNYRTASSGCDFQPTIIEAALATSAAQTYFSEIKIGASFFVDGAIGANNPTADVEAEARDLWCEETGNLQPLVKCFVSIGTGHPGVGKGADKRVAHLLKILKQQATQTESMNQEFLGRWRDHVKRGKCFRFNVTHGLEHVRLQEYEEQGQLQSATTAYLVEHETKTRVRICVENLRSKSCT